MSLGLSEDMIADGHTDITNIDTSTVCIKVMKERYRDAKNMTCVFYRDRRLCLFVVQLMDATKLSFANDTFDGAINKGTVCYLFVLNQLSMHGFRSGMLQRDSAC